MHMPSKNGFRLLVSCCLVKSEVHQVHLCWGLLGATAVVFCCLHDMIFSSLRFVVGVGCCCWWRLLVLVVLIADSGCLLMLVVGLSKKWCASKTVGFLLIVCGHYWMVKGYVVVEIAKRKPVRLGSTHWWSSLGMWHMLLITRMVFFSLPTINDLVCGFWTFF